MQKTKKQKGKQPATRTTSASPKKTDKQTVKKPQGNAAVPKSGGAGKRRPQTGKTAAQNAPSVKPVKERSQKSRSTTIANHRSRHVAQQKKPPKRKNVSQTIPNGTLIITNDTYFYGTDGKSNKKRMAVTVDTNRNDELAIVKYTTSQKHGRSFENSKGFVGHGDKIYTLDNNKKPIKADGEKFITQEKRKITAAQSNEIKRRNIKESKYKAGNRKNLQNLKKRKK